MVSFHFHYATAGPGYPGCGRVLYLTLPLSILHSMIMETIMRIASSIPVIMVSHDENLAKSYASRIIRIDDGHILSDTPNTPISINRDVLIKPKSSKISPLRLSVKLLKSRPWMNLTKSLLIIAFLSLTLFTLFLLSTTYSSYLIKEAYRTGSNIIVSLPNKSFSIEKRTK